MQTIMNWSVALLALVILLMTPAAFASEGPAKGGHLIVCVGDEPPGLDPTTNVAAAIKRITWSNLLETLLKVDDEGKLIPGLAEKWTISTDGKVYTFHLRKGVKFHNGEPFNAQVAKWNLERGAAEKTLAPHPEYFRVIGKIETPDENTLVCTLKEPNALFLYKTVQGDMSMLSPNAYKDAKTDPVGTGPFKFVKWVKGDRVELTRFEGYWNPDLPYVDKLTFRFVPDPSAQVAALKAGDVQVLGWLQAPEMALELDKDKRFRVTSGISTSEVIISINNKAKPFDNLKVRQAMAYALNRQEIIDLACSGFGQPIGSLWPPKFPYYVDLTGMYPYNPAKAKALLAEAGHPDGFEAVLHLPDRYAYAIRAGQVAADQLARVGIKLRIEMIEWGQWIARIFKNKEYQLTVIGQSEPWDIEFYTKPTYYWQYESKEFQNAYANAIHADNEAEMAKWLGECQKIVARDAASGYLFIQPYLPVVRAEVQGWRHNLFVSGLDCTRVWFKK